MDYNSKINRVVREIPPSGIRKYFDLIGDGYISLGVGEPDFPTPEPIRRLALERLSKGRIAYTSNAGDPKLRELILRYLDDRFQIRDYPSIDNVLITVGASQAIDLAMRAIVDPGDEVIVHEPVYVAYIPAINMAGGREVRIRTEAKDRFRLTPEALKKAITPKTKAILLAFPTNPTGAVMDREELEAIADVLRDRDILVVTDEIYAELTFSGKRHCSFASLPGMAERTIVISGFSKAFSMTGWRLGYAVGPEPLIAAMRKIHQLTMLSAPTPAQVAGIGALEISFKDGYREMYEMLDEYARRRRLIIDGFNALGLTCNEPEGAFYVFPSVASTGLSSEEFCERLLKAQKVVTIPGTAFGEAGEGHIRCCYATSEDDIKEALDRIGVFVKTL